MNIILFAKTGRPYQLNLRHGPVLASLILGLVLVCGGLLAGGYFLAASFGPTAKVTQLENMRAELAQQRSQIADLKRNAQDDMNALAIRLGQVQAHIMRIDALGERLTKMAGIDKDEFDFSREPAQGGPETSADDSGQIPQVDFMASLDQVSAEIQKRETQLTVLENLLMNRNLQKQVMPAGRPIQSGWLSSYFGYRTDPFTGRRAFHAGLDFAGKRGSKVEAVAAGVVTWAGSRYGYGNLVEINHGNGYVTRYGHNEKVLVHVGDTVKKGQVISLMGSTGRSTGPHVHFEVIHNGRVVNPLKFVQAD